MHKLTEKRLEKARDILEKYRTQLYEHGSFCANGLERELRGCWDTGYRIFKEIMPDIFQNRPRYKYVAAYYMQHPKALDPCSIFKKLLASLYHLKSYDCPERDEAISEFWERFSSDDAKSLRRQIDEARNEWERLDAHGSQSERQNQISVKIDRLETQLQELTGEEY